MVKWQYFVAHTTSHDNPEEALGLLITEESKAEHHYESRFTNLHKLGDDGWNLILINDIIVDGAKRKQYIFKRSVN